MHSLAEGIVEWLEWLLQQRKDSSHTWTQPQNLVIQHSLTFCQCYCQVTINNSYSLRPSIQKRKKINDFSHLKPPFLIFLKNLWPFSSSREPFCNRDNARAHFIINFPECIYIKQLLCDAGLHICRNVYVNI